MGNGGKKSKAGRGLGPRFWLRRTLRKWPFLVWLAAAVGCYWLFRESDEFIGMSGVVATGRSACDHRRVTIESSLGLQGT